MKRITSLPQFQLPNNYLTNMMIPQDIKALLPKIQALSIFMQSSQTLTSADDPQLTQLLQGLDPQRLSSYITTYSFVIGLSPDGEAKQALYQLQQLLSSTDIQDIRQALYKYKTNQQNLLTAEIKEKPVDEEEIWKIIEKEKPVDEEEIWKIIEVEEDQEEIIDEEKIEKAFRKILEVEEVEEENLSPLAPNLNHKAAGTTASSKEFNYARFYSTDSQFEGPSLSPEKPTPPILCIEKPIPIGSFDLECETPISSATQVNEEEIGELLKVEEEDLSAFAPIPLSANNSNHTTPENNQGNSPTIITNNPWQPNASNLINQQPDIISPSTTPPAATPNILKAESEDDPNQVYTSNSGLTVPPPFEEEDESLSSLNKYYQEIADGCLTIFCEFSKITDGNPFLRKEQILKNINELSLDEAEHLIEQATLYDKLFMQLVQQGGVVVKFYNDLLGEKCTEQKCYWVHIDTPEWRNVQMALKERIQHLKIKNEDSPAPTPAEYPKPPRRADHKKPSSSVTELMISFMTHPGMWAIGSIVFAGGAVVLALALWNPGLFASAAATQACIAGSTALGSGFVSLAASLSCMLFGGAQLDSKKGPGNAAAPGDGAKMKCVI